MEKAIILVGFTEAEGKPFAEKLAAQQAGAQVVVLCEPSSPQQTLEAAMKEILWKMPSRPFARMFKKRCPYDNDGDGNCRRHPNGCP